MIKSIKISIFLILIFEVIKMKKFFKISIFLLVFLLTGYFLIFLLSPSIYLNHLYEIEIDDKNDQHILNMNLFGGIIPGPSGRKSVEKA